MTAEATQSALEGWLSVLDAMERGVESAIAELDARNDAAATPDSDFTSKSTGGRVRIDDWMAGFESRLGAAQELVARVRSLLDEDERFALNWQKTVTTAGQRPLSTERLS